MNQEILLFGAGGHAKVILDCILESKNIVVGIFDDDEDLVSLNGHTVLGHYDPTEFSHVNLVIAVGDNKTRKKIVADVSHRFGHAIHPSAVVSKFSRIEVGTMVIHGAVVQSGVSIGKHCILNTLSSVDHDSTIADFVHISPRACVCSNVQIAEGTHLGAGATVLPGVKIGKWCVVGAGAVINKDIPDFSVVVGVPGKVVGSTSEDF